MKEEILALRRLGHTLSQISEMTGYSLTDVCKVVYDQNNEEKYFVLPLDKEEEEY